MKKQISIAIGACLALSISLSLLAFGGQDKKASSKEKERASSQEKVSPKNKGGSKGAGISAADQKEIQALFKGVDPSQYRLRFNQGKKVVGARNVTPEDLQQVKKFRNPAEAAGWIVFIVEGDDVIYVLAIGNSKLTDVIGREKAARLNQIVAKYGR